MFQWILPVMIAIVSILLVSLLKGPNRRYFMAIMVGGAGSVYLSGGGFGKWAQHPHWDAPSATR
jgi:Family of unknown function (DUF6010)